MNSSLCHEAPTGTCLPAPVDELQRGHHAATHHTATQQSSSSEFDSPLGNTLAAFLPVLGDFGFFDVVTEDGVRRTARAHENPELETLLQQTSWVRSDHAALSFCALSSKKPLCHVDIDDDWYRRAALDDAHLALLRRLAFRSVISVPMYDGDELIGALTLFAGLSGKRHSESDLRFAAKLAALAAPVVINARLLKRQQQAEAALRASEERLRLATNAGKIGIWDWDIITNHANWSEQVFELHGMTGEEFGGRVEDFLDLVVPEDRDWMRARLEDTLRSGDMYTAEFRVMLPAGGTRWLATWAHVHRDAQGRAIRMVGANMSIDDQKRSHARLEQSNARLAERAASSESERERIWRMSQDILAVIALDGNLVNVNPAFCRTLGWEADEAGSLLRLIHPAQRDAMQEHLASLAAGRTLDGIELQLLHRNGSYRWLSWTLVPEGDRSYGIGRDVSVLRLRNERLLAASETRLQLALEVGGMGAWQWDIQSQQSIWWPGMARLHGLPQGSVAQSFADYADLLHPEDRQLVAQTVEQALQTRQNYRMEYRVIWPDGSVHWIESRSQFTLDERGEPLQLSGVCVDISHRKRMEQDLRFVANVSAELAMLQNYQETLEKIARLAVPSFADWCAVDLVDDEGNLDRVAVAHVDPQKRTLGVELFKRYPPKPDTPGGTWQVIRNGRAEHVAIITDATLAASIRDPEYLAIIRELGLYSYIGAPLQAHGKTLGAITFISAESRRVYGPDDVALAEDIGRRAGIAIENAKLYRSLQDADRRKDEFLAMLAHELRNPLAPVRAAADLLRLPLPPNELARTSEVISRQVDHMTELVDDLLDVSRVTRGLVVLERRPIDLKQVSAAAVEQIRPLLEARGHRLVLEIDAAPLHVEGDEKRLVQVVANLLGNAAKYTPERGRIVLELLEGRDADVNNVILAVSDNGIGMTPELVTRVFELFVQAERSADRAQGGLGLGLPLVKSLVELHGGKVKAVSKGLGCGTTFTVRLPRLPAPPTTQIPPRRDIAERKKSDHRALRILLVDDNVDAAEVLGMLLRTQGHEVRVEHGSRAALDWLHQHDADLCLLDIGLPDMDGNELARRIRALQRSELRLVAITGYGQERDREAGLAAGFDHYLVKPVNPDRLSALVHEVAAYS